jgi:uncharacterized protein
MIFEFDSEKSERNKEKHGIDFVDAQKLWDDSRSFGFQARSDDEPRFAMIAEFNTKLWVAFYTIRENRVRIISVRRARKGEEILYES